MDRARERARGVRIVRGHDPGEEDGGKGAVDDGSAGDGEDGARARDLAGARDAGAVLSDGRERGVQLGD